jgi:hypothetical protein
MMALIRLFLAALTLFGLSACTTTTSLAKLDGEFVDLYQTKVKYQATSEGFFPVPDGISQGFAELSTRAEQAAAKLKGDKKDARLKVSYYRIATLASWQAGEADEDKTLGVIQKGKDACQNLKEYGLSSPRDCLFIEFSAPLAIQDNEQRKLDSLLEPYTQGDVEADELPASLLQPIRSITVNLLTQFKNVQRLREENRLAPVDPRFWSAIDKQQLIIYCNADAARTELVKVQGEGAAAAARLYTKQGCAGGDKFFCQQEIEMMNVRFTSSSCLKLQQHDF